MSAVMRKTIWAGIVVGLSALGIACSSSSSSGDNDACGFANDYCEGQLDSGNDGAPDARADAGDASTCPVQSYPVNAAACPAHYDYTLGGQACAPAGLDCYYPGAGDIGANGCPATAELLCEFPDSGVGEIPDAAIFADAGDASVGYWTFAQ